MPTLKAFVRDGRAVLVEDRVDYPDGTELQLDVRDPADEFDAEELAELDSAQPIAVPRCAGATGRRIEISTKTPDALQASPSPPA